MSKRTSQNGESYPASPTRWATRLTPALLFLAMLQTAPSWMAVPDSLRTVFVPACQAAPLAQWCLLSLVAVCGPGRWPIRLFIVAGYCILAWFVGLSLRDPTATGAEVLSLYNRLLLSAVSASLVAALALRMLGWKMFAGHGSGSGRDQFSILSLLIFVVLVSLLLTVGNSLRNSADAAFQELAYTPPWIVVAAHTVTATSVAVCSMFLVLRSRSLLISLPALLLTACLMGIWQAHTCHHADQWRTPVIWLIAHAAWLATAWFILRQTGIQLHRQQPAPLARFISLFAARPPLNSTPSYQPERREC